MGTPARLEIDGASLLALVEAVRREYWRRSPYEDYAGGLRQVNTVRVVACQILEGLPRERQRAVLGDLYELDSIGLARDDPGAVFAASDSIGSHLFDLACEVVWQTLVEDFEVRVEDEVRLALATA